MPGFRVLSDRFSVPCLASCSLLAKRVPRYPAQSALEKQVLRCPGLLWTLGKIGAVLQPNSFGSVGRTRQGPRVLVADVPTGRWMKPLFCFASPFVCARVIMPVITCSLRALGGFGPCLA